MNRLNRKNPALWALGALALALTTGPVSADDSIEFHGYIRSGAAVNQDLLNAKNDNASGTGISSNLIGRLGNENDSWVESELVKKIVSDDGTWAKMHVGTSYSSNDMANPLKTVNVGQAYVELGGFGFDPQATFFVGMKDNREDIHIMDFKWRKIDGAGFGVNGALGGNLDVNILTPSNVTSGNGTTSVPVNLDVRYKLLPSLQVEATAGYAKDATKITADSTTADHGYQGAVVYYWDRFYGLPGWMTLAAQAGYGLYGGSVKDSTWNALGQLGNLWAIQESFAYRLVTSGTGTFGDVDVAAGLWGEYDQTQQKTWSSSAGANVVSDPRIIVAAAARPAWKLTKNLSLVGEAGLSDQIGGGYWWDATTSTSYQRTGLSYKFTVAPTLALDSGVGARPQLRLFATYVGQDKKLGLISTDGKQDHEFKAGVQAEVWW